MTPQQDRSPEQPLSSATNNNQAGPSEHPPPSFHESGGDVVVELDQVPDAFPEGGEEPPSLRRTRQNTGSREMARSFPMTPI